MENFTFNKLVHFSFRLLLIIIIIFACDQGIGTVLRYLYFNQKSGTGYQANYAIDSTTADILIFGSSRANHHYVPDVFEERLPYTCYNTGRDGNFILYNYAIFKVIIKRHIPKTIIFDINPSDIETNLFDYDRLSRLLPYYRAHPEIRPIVNLRSPFEKIKHISSIYPFNSLILFIAMGNLASNQKRTFDIKGYEPAYRVMKDLVIDTTRKNDCHLDKNIIQALEDIIVTCQQKSIELVFVYSPVWSIIQESSCNSIISDLCSKTGISYLDLSNDSTFINNPSYFADKIHLNDKGAREFSDILINKIWADN